MNRIPMNSILLVNPLVLPWQDLSVTLVFKNS